MTKLVWLPNETDYSYCEFVAPNTPYSVLPWLSGKASTQNEVGWVASLRYVVYRQTKTQMQS